MDQITHKYSLVRRYAREVMNNSTKEKTCILCKDNIFDEVVEVCHIKGIATFPNNTLLTTVNNLNNLVYLCPSHHKLFDKGLIKIKDINNK